MKTILKVLIHLIGFQSYADEASYDMHELLLRYNLVAHVKISSHGQDHFRVKVLNVLDRRKSGIVNGDYLKVSYDFNIVCPPTFPQKYAEEHREALAFLSYYNGQWHLNHGTIAFIENGQADVRFNQEGYDFKAPLSVWEDNLKEYTYHFSENKQGRLVLKRSLEKFKGQKLTALTQLQYARYYHKEYRSLSRYKYMYPIEMIEPLEEDNSSVLKRDLNTIHSFASIAPISDSMVLNINNQLIDIIRKGHPELQENGIIGQSIYSLTFEKDGQISEIEILRSFTPGVSQEIKSYFSINNQWKPAENDNGDPIRFRQVMVFTNTIEKINMK